MSLYKSDFLREAQARGFIHQCTNSQGLDDLLSREAVVAYIGFDPTADSLHAGSLLQIMWLRLLQKHGHKPIALMGGATGKIGDPTGKDEQRQLMTDATLESNIQGIRKDLEKYVDFSKGAQLVNNDDWTKDVRYIDFLRQYGVHFTINRMLTFDSVQLRLERQQPLTFLEFNYMLLQAYDFLILHQQYGCVLQLGGSDQWGNIVNGVELVRRVQSKEVFGLTSPLLTTASGAKMGKSVSGAIWLSADKLSPFDFWQYWRNAHDNDVGRFLRLFTDLSIEEITRLEALKGSETNEAKKILADEVTRLCHGDAAVTQCRAAASTLFEGAQGDEAALPQLTLPQDLASVGVRIVDLFVQAQLTASLGETRRLIQGQGAKLNDQVIVDGEAVLTAKDFGPDRRMKLSAGKKRHIIVHLPS